MREFFNMDNPFFRALGKLADLMILNITFLVCCIPVFTIGASLTGLYYVTLKMAENEEGYIIRSFLKSFKQNFKQATLIWLGFLLIIIVLVMDFQIIKVANGAFSKVFYISFIAIAFFFLMIACYIFPVLSRFYNTILGTLKNSTLMAVAYLPYTLLMVVVTAGPAMLTFFNSYTLLYGVMIWFLAGFSLIAYVNSLLLKRIFKKHMPEEKEEGNPDHWEVSQSAGDIPPEQSGDTATQHLDMSQSAGDIPEDVSEKV